MPTKLDSSAESPWPAHWLTCLKIGTSLTLFARGWLTWRWDSPIRTLFWQEDWWSSVLDSGFALSWSTWAEESDAWITPLLKGLGLILILSALLPWIAAGAGKGSRLARGLLWVAFGILFLDSLARWVGHDYELGMGIEHALQMAMPLALFYALGRSCRPSRWALTLGLASALTFIGHGLYASGFHGVPLSYQTMTSKILRIEDPGLTKGFLQGAGWLDFVAAIGIFIRPLRTASLLYMILWGAATALARTWAHAGWDSPLWGLDPWIAETLVRTPHWMIPLLLFWLHRIRRFDAD